MSASELLPVAAVLTAFATIRLAELRIHRANLDFILVVGGEEIVSRAMQLYYRWHLIFLAPALAEHFFGHRPAALLAQSIGLGMIITGVLLRLWVINTLGRFWTMRCVFVPGTPRVISGPFRFVAHPEYLARALEACGLCLFLGAGITLAVYVVVSANLLIKIVKNETNQIRQLSHGTL